MRVKHKGFEFLFDAKEAHLVLGCTKLAKLTRVTLNDKLIGWSVYLNLYFGDCKMPTTEEVEEAYQKWLAALITGE